MVDTTQKIRDGERFSSGVVNYVVRGRGVLVSLNRVGDKAVRSPTGRCRGPELTLSPPNTTGTTCYTRSVPVHETGEGYHES